MSAKNPPSDPHGVRIQEVGHPERREDSTLVTQTESLGTLKPKTQAHRDRACLILLAGGGVGEMHPLDKPVTVLGRGHEADIRIDDAGISRRHARVVRIPAGGYVLEDLGSTNGTFVAEKAVERHTLSDGDRVGLGRTTVLKFMLQDELEETFQRQMYESSVRDPLTRAFNRKYFIDRLRTELSYASRHKSALSLLLLDLDFFKTINDSRGHLAGDAVLRALCSMLTGLLRAEDVVARYGGEEFAVLIRGIDARNTEILAERLRRAVEGLAVPWVGGPIRATVSIGVAFSADGSGFESPDRMIARADEHLYAAKNAGRNRVVM